MIQKTYFSDVKMNHDKLLLILHNIIILALYLELLRKKKYYLGRHEIET